MSFEFNRPIHIQSVGVNVLGLIELLLQLFSDGDRLTVLHHVLGKLVKEFLFGQGLRSINIFEVLELLFLCFLVDLLHVVGFLALVYWFQRHTFRVFRFQVVREISV